MVRAMVAQQYSSLENNVFDSRMLVALLYKHFHRGIVNVRHEVLPGMPLQQVQSGRVGMVMSAIIKNLRANGNKDRIQVIGLSSAAKEARALQLDESVINWLSHDAGIVTHQPHAQQRVLALSTPYDPPSDIDLEILTKSVQHVDARTRRRAGNANRDAPVAKGAVMSLEKQAELANLAAQKRGNLKGDKKGDKHYWNLAHASDVAPRKLLPAHFHDTTHLAAAGGAKLKIKEANKEESEDGLLGALSEREQRIVTKILALDSSLPKPIPPTSYLRDGPLETSSDAMKQHLQLEVNSLNAILVRVGMCLTRMASLVLGYCGSSAAAHMEEILPDLIAVDSGRPPATWLAGCAPSWDTSSLDAWMETLQTAHMQLYQWARQGCLRSYYLPALLHPFVFLSAAKLHTSRRSSTSRLEVVPIDEAIVVLSPTNKMHPWQLPSASTNTIIHVHGLVLHGGALDRNVLSDPPPGQSSSPLPVMQLRALQLSSLHAAFEIALECPVMVVRVQPHDDEAVKSADEGMRPAVSSAAVSQAAGQHLISIVMPLENGQDQHRAVLRGVHAMFDSSPNRSGLVPGRGHIRPTWSSTAVQL
jgi:hypothetical protein